MSGEEGCSLDAVDGGPSVASLGSLRTSVSGAILISACEPRSRPIKTMVIHAKEKASTSKTGSESACQWGIGSGSLLAAARIVFLELVAEEPGRAGGRTLSRMTPQRAHSTSSACKGLWHLGQTGMGFIRESSPDSQIGSKWCTIPQARYGSLFQVASHGGLRLSLCR